ncbi:MAG: glucosamine-6-phosphate deaminase [Bacilli bacterium]|jgi:glucosamine-6-phosphate deaminase|nr:glucosamine-6-phosphate deaminase [Bacilli bacterium]HHU24421.1 glucosamine-6-phosphate deaminase [Acholeplasmataceae bacterium]
MKIIVVENYEQLSNEAAKIIINQLQKKPNSVMGLATGATPMGMYEALRKAYANGEVSFKDVTTFNLDEYCGIDPNHPQSYHYYMQQNLFNHIDVKPENVHLPSATSDWNSAAKSYNDLLKQTKIDLQVLGIGSNGHIGFNEPGTSFEQETFVVELAEKTRLDNQRFFNSLEEVPRFAITMGIKNIMQAKQILLLISGKNKAKTAKRLLEGKVGTDFPASVLHLHKSVTIILDEDAYGLAK